MYLHTITLHIKKQESVLVCTPKFNILPYISAKPQRACLSLRFSVNASVYQQCFLLRVDNLNSFEVGSTKWCAVC